MFPRIAAIIICFAVGTIALTAQAQATGSLRGTVVDSSGNTMPGVTITVSGPERRQVVTNAQGQFSFSTMPLGDYEVRATLVGFETTVRKVTVTEVTDAVRIRMDIKGDAGDVVFIGRNP